MKKRFYLSFVALMLAATSVMAAPKVSMDITVEALRTIEEDGKQVQKIMKVDTAEPGEELIYTIQYSNSGDEAASNVNIKNRIPDNSSYLLDSAWGEGSDITFSADGGSTFSKPSLLTYEVKAEDGKKTQKAISPEKYTDIQWVVKDIPAGKSGKVGFKIKVD